MDANMVMDKKFTEAIRGYKKEEVDEFLSDVSRELSRTKRENAENEKKLEVLAHKIREYQEDEDALKDALLGAQKQGNAIIAEAKEKAAAIIKEAEEKSAAMIKEAEDNVAAKKEEAEKITADALAEKERIEQEAKKAADDIHTEMMIQTELDKEVLDRTRREAEDFRTRLIVEYTNHIEFIKKLPEQCENEFVKETAANHDTNVLRGLIASQHEAAAAVEKAPEKPHDDSDVKVVGSFGDIPVQEGEAEEIEEEAGGFTVENAFGDDEPESSAPEFLNSRPGKNKSKFEKLEFGSNNNNNNNGNKNGKKRR